MESDISDEFCDEPREVQKPRKRKICTQEWKKSISKQKKYDEKASKEPKISCHHMNNFCDAGNLTKSEISQFHSSFWKNKDAVPYLKQNFIASFLDITSPIRRRPNQGKQQGKSVTKNVTLKYKVQTGNGTVSVCRDSFLSILNVGRRKVENAAKEKNERGINLLFISLW